MAIPTQYVGQPGGLSPSWSPVAGHGYAAWGWEDNPDLTFPFSVYVYDRMRRTDTQIASILRSVTLPLRATEWRLDTEGVDPAVAAFVEDQLNLRGGSRRHGGIVWDEHLREVLLALAWGFAPFETIYEMGPGRTPGAPAVAANLKALAARPPRTLTEVRVTREGDLEGVVQLAPTMDTAYYGGYMASPSTGGAVRVTGSGDIFIPRDRLAFYSLDREGADWTGTSLLRAAYKDWYLKEQAVRFAGQGVERNSMGLPVVEYDDDGDRQLALDIATAARAGATAGVAIPRGRMSFTLQGVSGSTTDPLPLITYHDRAMTRSALAMFLDLGHDNGARSLGETFMDFFTASLQSLAKWVATTATEEVIKPLVAINFGDDTLAPTLTSEAITARHGATAESMKLLVEAGILTPDVSLEVETRRSYGLPPLEGERPVLGLPQPTQDRTAVGQAVAQASALVDRLAALAAERQ